MNLDFFSRVYVEGGADTIGWLQSTLNTWSPLVVALIALIGSFVINWRSQLKADRRLQQQLTASDNSLRSSDGVMSLSLQLPKNRPLIITT